MTCVQVMALVVARAKVEIQAPGGALPDQKRSGSAVAALIKA